MLLLAEDKKGKIMSDNQGVRIGIKIVLTIVILFITGIIRGVGGGWMFTAMGAVGIIAIWKWKPEEK